MDQHFIFIDIKKTFFSIGGLNESLKESICEDLDFGIRLTRAGCGIFLDKNTGITHLKYLTMPESVRLEYKRARAIMQINIESLLSGNLVQWPVRFSFRATFFLLPLFYSSFILAFFDTNLFFSVFLFLLALLYILNIRFLSFISKIKGFLFSFRSFFVVIFGVTIAFIAIIIEIPRYTLSKVLLIAKSKR